MTNVNELLKNIVHEFKLYVDTIDPNIIDEEFMRLDTNGKINRLFSVTSNLNLSRDFTIYFINYLIDLKYNEHLKIFYKKDNLTSSQIVDEITKKVIKRSLDYHCFKEEINDIKYDPRLDKWDTIWLTDIPERVIINLLSDNRHSLYRIIGMSNIDNYNKLKYFKDLISGFKYLRNIKDYESIAYLLTRNFGRDTSIFEMANVKSNNEFNIRSQSFKERVDSIKHESIHSKYKHTERFSMMKQVYLLSNSNYLKIFRENYTEAIESCVSNKLYGEDKSYNNIIMNHVLNHRWENNWLCRRITSTLKTKEHKGTKYK